MWRVITELEIRTGRKVDNARSDGLSFSTILSSLSNKNEQHHTQNTTVCLAQVQNETIQHTHAHNDKELTAVEVNNSSRQRVQ